VDIPPLVVALCVFGAALVVICPLSTLVHELGHALCYTRLTGRRATVYVGRRPTLLTWQLKRLDLHFDPREGGPLLGRHQTVIDPRGMTASQLRQVLLAGPAATALLGFAFFLAAIGAVGNPGGPVFVAAATSCVACFMFVIEDLVPHGRPGHLSDGAKIKMLGGYPPQAVAVSPDHTFGPPTPNVPD
jgi:hypothetical protein